MAFLWIFALAIVAVAAAEEQIGAAPGCGEPEAKPQDREYGTVEDVNSCKRRVLKWRGMEFLASCILYCPGKNYSYALKFIQPSRPLPQVRKKRLPARACR
uniref:Putative evasin n=1 Tax=Amblyomma americanum TaxID=6943 RepID=A0A0C9SEL9_AMBAM